MTQEAKVIAGIGIVTLAIIVGGVFFFNKSSQTQSNPQSKVTDEKLLIGKDSHKIASDSAKVTIVEFGDYQCPACGAAHPVVKQILSDYQGRITFVFRNFPLPMHSNAKISAEAAEAAGAQGKFWEMHDKLYESQATWAETAKPLDLFVSYAQEFGLDTSKFKEEVEGNKYAERINKDQTDGNTLGVNSTPTFFINGEKLVGTPNYNSLKSMIDSRL